MAKVEFVVFTKAWKVGLGELAELMAGWGIDGVELPVRPGFQVEPGTVEQGLAEAVRVLGDYGLKIASVAGPTDERMIAACGEAGVGLIRTMVEIPRGQDYLSAIGDCQRGWDRLVPRLEESGVTLGVQNHCGRYIANAMDLRHAIGGYDRRHVCAIWDAAHNVLQGEDVDLALDIVWSHLGRVNLKNAFCRRVNEAGAPVARWEYCWTTGREGRADWAWVAEELKQRGYGGDVCLCAEYSDEGAVDRLIREDVEFAKSLFA